MPSLPERVALVQRIFRGSVEEGRGYRSIVQRLNENGIPSPRDGNWSKNTQAKWSVGTIRSILRNPAYRGDTVWNRRTFAKFHTLTAGVPKERARVDADKPRHNPECDWSVVPGTHEPLISPPIFDRAQELMKLRGRNSSQKTFRSGSGMRSPFLLSGLIRCGRCGHSYQGRTVNASKRRKDGSKIQTRYYACGGFVNKGRATCEKFLLRKIPLEEYLLDDIRDRLKTLLDGEASDLLKEFLAEELATRGPDPRREKGQIRARLLEIDRKADVLLETMTDDISDFVNTKLRDLATEKRRLQARMEALDEMPYEPIDADTVLRDGLTALQDLPRLTCSPEAWRSARNSCRRSWRASPSTPTSCAWMSR